MTVVRRDVMDDAPSRDSFVEGVRRLKAEPVRDGDRTLTTADLGIPSADGTGPRPLSTYDVFVLWHHRTMMVATPAGSRRNAAHVGPVFLPWHRLMLMMLERNMQRVLEEPSFALPYWDWAADGALPPGQQPGAWIWGPTAMGGDGAASDGDAVTDGPFSAASGFRLVLWADSVGRLWSVDRPLRRRFAPARQPVPTFGLPTPAEVASCLALRDYDDEGWDLDAPGFRNAVEGWADVEGRPAPNLHNRVHVWIGGDMAPSTSPNDPVFFLNHGNVDRIWSSWQARPGSLGYAPADTAPADLFRHRPGDPLISFFPRDDAGTPWRVGDMFDVEEAYRYDALVTA